MNFSNLYFLFGSNFIFGLFISEKIMLFNILLTKLSIETKKLTNLLSIVICSTLKCSLIVMIY